jgi:hypothetical protein
MNNQKPTNLIVDISRTKGLKCHHCGNEMFYAVSFLREIPSVLSPTMKPEVAPVPAFQCTKCNRVYDWSVPSPEKKKTLQKIVEYVPFVLGLLKYFKIFPRK